MELFNQLEALKPLYFNETNPVKKQEYKNQIEELISKITKGRKKFDFEVYFSEVFHEKGGFDVVIANPPYGADIDKMVKIYARLYPYTTKAFKDIYKIFIELGLKKLTSNNGVLCYIIPNTLLLQPRYKDARGFLLNFRIKEILNLGEGVFEDVVVLNCIIFVQNNSPEGNFVKFGDLTDRNKFIKNALNRESKLIEQKDYQNTPDNIFTPEIRNLSENEILLGTILELKDCGIKYQRVGIGLSKKGKSDLTERIFYEGKRKNKKDKKFLIGKDLHREGWYINFNINRYIKHNFKKLLKDNEIVYFNEDFFNKKEKIVWRQTSPYFVGALLSTSIWFANTLQGGILKEEYKKQFSIKYILALLNSKYLRYVYTLLVREEGRVFPQVKLSKLKQVPIKKISLSKQKPFIDLVNKILSLTQSEDYLEDPQKQTKVKEYERQIDQLVYKLYGLTEEEIKIIENYAEASAKNR